MGGSGRVTMAVYAAVDEINRQLDPEERLEKSMETAVFGGPGGLDSLGLINLIVEVEERIAREWGVAINLADESVIAREDSPFQSLGALVAHVTSLVEGGTHEG